MIVEKSRFAHIHTTISNFLTHHHKSHFILLRQSNFHRVKQIMKPCSFRIGPGIRRSFLRWSRVMRLPYLVHSVDSQLQKCPIALPQRSSLNLRVHFCSFQNAAKKRMHCNYGPIYFINSFKTQKM